MIIKWAGKDYTYDPGSVTVSEAVMIKSHTGMGLVSWERSVRDADPQALQALLWLVKRRNGEICEPASLDFDMIGFLRAYGDGLVETAQPVVEESGKADSPDGQIPGQTAI